MKPSSGVRQSQPFLVKEVGSGIMCNWQPLACTIIVSLCTGYWGLWTVEAIIGRLNWLWEIATISKRSAVVRLVWCRTLFCTVCGSEVEAPWSSRSFRLIARSLYTADHDSLMHEANQTLISNFYGLKLIVTHLHVVPNLYDFQFMK